MHSSKDGADSRDLAGFGYRQELSRSLGSFSSFAAGFSYISILTGMFQMFYLGFGAGGPAFFWSWPMMFCGHFLIALCFAELAAHYPLSGGVYQWSKYLGSPFLGWMTGWIFFACLVVTLAAVALAMQNSLPQIWTGFQFVGSLDDPKSRAVNAVLLGCGVIVLSTVINAVGVRLLAFINNAGVLSEIVGIGFLVVALAMYSVRSPADAVFSTQGRSDGQSLHYIGPFLTATALTASYVMYGYDTAGTLAEETHDPRHKAPRAILQALSAAALLGMLILLFALMAAPDLGAAKLSASNGGLPAIVTDVLGSTLGKALLFNVVFAIFVCTLAVHSGAVRLLFAMARDGVVPLSRTLSRVPAASQVPALPAVLAGTGAIVLLLANVGFPKVVEVITSVAILWANLSYLAVVAALLRKRLQGWPGRGGSVEGTRAFRLGSLGIPINLAALCWSAFMVVNVGWPRAEIFGAEQNQRFAGLLYTGVLVAVGALLFWVRRTRGASLVIGPDVGGGTT